MSESEKDLDKFLYGGEFANEDSQTKKAENESLEELEEEEEEDDYEIILDTSKLPTSNSVGNLNNDLNKRSLTSVSIGEGKEGEISQNAESSAANSISAPAQVSHFDPFAPGNLNGTQIFDHDLDSFEDKPWRKPGADLTDYFNFGFNEVTWRAYCVKQKVLREEFGLQKKIGVYDSSGVSNVRANSSTYNTSNTSLNSYGSQGHSQGGSYGSGHNPNYNPNYQQQNRPPRDFNRPRPPYNPNAAGNDGQRGHPTYPRQDQSQSSYPRSNDPAQSSYSRQDQQSSYPRNNDQQQAYNRPLRTYSQESHSRPQGHAIHNRSPSPPPPPPPRNRSRSRSRSPDSSTRRIVSNRSGSRYEDSSRSPPSKRRRD